MKRNLWWRIVVWGTATLLLLVATAGALIWPMPQLLRGADRTLIALQRKETLAPPKEQSGQASDSQPASIIISSPRSTVSTSPSTPAPSSTLISQQSPTPTSATGSPGPVSSPSPAPRIALGSGLPPRIADLAQEWATQYGVAIAGDSPADMDLSLTPSSGAHMVAERIFVPAQRFSSLRERITLDELQQSWTEPDASPRLLIADDTAADLAALWGAARGDVGLVHPEELVEALWRDGEAVGIVPFDRLEPRLSPLDLDGLSALDNRLERQEWPLAVRVWLRGSGPEADDLLGYFSQRLALTNRDPEKLTVLVMTGVTAMSRMTASRMERYGDYAYPAHVIGPELAAADITHISNEVPLVPGCRADPTLNNVVLCSKPEYLAALEEVGADIVGLTGNHQNDFGHEAMLTSLEIYAQHGLKVYAGGANDQEARRPLTITHHGNRLAFLGANAYGPTGAWATADTPGSARFDLETMRKDIAALKPLADVVLVEIQHIEFDPSGDYQVEPEPQQRADFEALSAAGAHIVTGVQAHRPQAVELTPNGIILFGLGNLFFDQMNWWETRQGLIARHAIYDGRHISTELLVTILEDWAQPRWATPEERGELLTDIFMASEW
jgi:hypothetical protein